jgi:predicted nucleic acid-binding protein
MPVYLLDSNVLSEIMRSPRGLAARTFERKAIESGSRLLTSIIVACEMRYGKKRIRTSCTTS